MHLKALGCIVIVTIFMPPLGLALLLIWAAIAIIDRIAGRGGIRAIRTGNRLADAEPWWTDDMTEEQVEQKLVNLRWPKG